METLKVQVNNPAKAGEQASDINIFGPRGRYAVYAVHTRFTHVAWFVVDAEQLDSLGRQTIVRQESTMEAAIEGLETV